MRCAKHVQEQVMVTTEVLARAIGALEAIDKGDLHEAAKQLDLAVKRWHDANSR